jgi:hypothetical protein
MNAANKVFEIVVKFMSLGTALTNKYSIRLDIKTTTNSGNVCYLSRIYFLPFCCQKLRRLKYTVVIFGMLYNCVKPWYYHIIGIAQSLLEHGVEEEIWA